MNRRATSRNGASGVRPFLRSFGLVAAAYATVGPWVQFDPDKELFTGEFADEANKLVTEDYRDEFKLPVIS